MFSLFSKAHRYLMAFIKAIICVLFIIMIVTGFSQVVLRYAFGVAYAWASELTQFSMVWMCFLGAAVLALEKGNINVDYFLGLMPPWLRMPIYVLSELALIVFIGLLVYDFVPTWRVDLRTLTPGLQIPAGWVTVSAVVGLTLIGLYTIIRTVRVLSSRC